MAMTRDQWIAIWDAAGGTKAVAGTAVPSTSPIPGRSISTIGDKLTQFWSDHRDTLAPFLTQAAIAALEALIAILPELLNLNKPGPG